MAKNSISSEGCFDRTVRVICNQNFADVSLTTAQVDVTASTVLVNSTGLVTGNLVPGTYAFMIHLAGTAGASGGLKVGLKFGTASMLTSIESTARGFTASAVAVQHSTTATDAASLFAATAADINCVIQGTLVVAIEGTLQLQFAQNVSDAAATSIYVGSYMTFNRVV